MAEALYFVPLVGLVAGILAGLLGIGGGLVIVPALLWVLHQSGSELAIQQAIATSLASIIATGAVSTFSHQRRGAVEWANVRLLAPGICLGAATGAVAVGVMPGQWLKILFALFAAWVGVHMWRAQPLLGDDKPMPAYTAWLVAPAMGFLSALVGIGGGSLTVPYMSAHGLSIQRAVGTASAIGVFLALAGAIAFVVLNLSDGHAAANSIGLIHWPSLLAIIATSVFGAPLGAHLAHRLPAAVLKRVFAVFLLAMAVWLAFA